MKSYERYEKFYEGHLTLYIRADPNRPINKPGVWQARMTFPGRKGELRRSLKTTQFEEALTEGKRLYLSLRAKHDQQLPLAAMSWTKLVDEFLKHRATYKDVREYTWVCTNFIKPFFEEFQDVTSISNADIAGYWNFRINYWDNHESTPISRAAGRKVSNKRPYSKTAAHREAIMLRSIFKFAFEQGYIGRVPRIVSPKLDQKVIPTRGRFCDRSYQSLISSLSRRCNAPPKKHQLKRGTWLIQHLRLQRLRFWVLLLANSGCRPAEAKVLTQKQITLRRDPSRKDVYFTQILMRAEQGKKNEKERAVITRDYWLTHKFYIRYLKVLASHRPDLIGDDKLIFPSFRHPEKPFDQMSAFRNYIQSIKTKTFPEGIWKDDNGQPRSSYSLRSYYITKRLEAGVPLYVVAHNCNTSYEMIYKHYAASLTWTMRDNLTINFDRWLAEEIDMSQPREAYTYDPAEMMKFKFLVPDDDGD